MNTKTVRALIGALEGVPRWEWEIFKRAVDERYDAVARQAVIPPEGLERIESVLYHEHGIGAVQPPEGNRQTTMF